MAVLTSVLGRFTQSIDNVNFRNWKGINVAARKATQVANPQSTAQMKQRAAITFLVAMSRSWLTDLKIYWSLLAIKMSQYNAFVKNNTSKLTYVTDHWELPTTGFLMTKGTLFPLTVSSITADQSDGDAVVTLAAAPNSIGYGANVNIYGIVFDKFGNKLSTVKNFGAASSLSSTSLTIDTFTGVAGDIVNAYVWAFDTFTKQVSDSSDARATTIA